VTHTDDTTYHLHTRTTYTHVHTHVHTRTHVQLKFVRCTCAESTVLNIRCLFSLNHSTDRALRHLGGALEVLISHLMTAIDCILILLFSFSHILSLFPSHSIPTYLTLLYPSLSFSLSVHTKTEHVSSVLSS
jgi:hypothetical protein